MKYCVIGLNRTRRTTPHNESLTHSTNPACRLSFLQQFPKLCASIVSPEILQLKI